MLKTIQFHLHRVAKYGWLSFFFYLRMKLKKDKVKDIKISFIRFPFSISNLGPDLTTLFQIFFAKEYEMPVNISPHYIIDLGANIGLSAIYYANRYPNAIIIALEPDEENFNLLKLNSQPYSNIIPLNKAIWSESKKINLLKSENGNWAYQTTDVKSESLKTVEAISLFDLIQEYNINRVGILKIDIEGTEKQIFSHNFCDWLKRVDTIAIELHPNIDKDIPDIFEKTISYLPHKKYYSGENLICDFRS